MHTGRYKYTTMAETVKKQSSLANYEPVILGCLYRYPSMTAAPVYDWLLEHYEMKVSERVVRRYVQNLRRENKIKKTSQPREYEAVEELPMGYQMQVDFGQQSMRTPDGQYVKVYFIGVVLSHSRYKWGYFLDRPFCSVDLVNCLDMILLMIYMIIWLPHRLSDSDCETNERQNITHFFENTQGLSSLIFQGLIGLLFLNNCQR